MGDDCLDMGKRARYIPRYKMEREVRDRDPKGDPGLVSDIGLVTW
jgi:hypothetical protein